MSGSSTAQVKHAGRSLALRFDACRLMLGGEFAGNVELEIACDPGDVDAVAASLRIRLPGRPESDPALADGAYAPGVELVFWCDPSGLPAEPPDRIEILWDQTPIASIAPRLEGSVPIRREVSFTAPAEILPNPPVATSRHVRLAANREKWWSLLAAATALCGGLAALALPAFALPDPRLGWAWVGTLSLGGIGIGAFLAWKPYRQVWLDRDLGQVFVVEGRFGNVESRLSRAAGRPLGDFDHVRVYQRWQIARDVDGRDQQVWKVTLEGAIPHAGSDGRVHLRSDALPVGEFATAHAARRLAAEVGVHTGLPILDTGHDQTA